MKMESLQDLLMHELTDLYSAEKQLVSALPKVAKAADNPQLKAAFEEHAQVTSSQAQRLERIFEQMDRKPPAKSCKAMKGLIEEADEVAKSRSEPAVRDAALIGAAQRVEHYEIAGYGCARTYAELLGEEEIAEMLDQTLSEEKEADQKLNDLALRMINLEAAEAETE